MRYFGLFPGVKLIQRCKPPWAMQILWAEQGIECNLSIYSSSIKQPFNLAGFVIQQTLLWSSLPKTAIWAWSEKFQVLLPQPVHKSTVPRCWARGALVYLRPCPVPASNSWAHPEPPCQPQVLHCLGMEHLQQLSWNPSVLCVAISMENARKSLIKCLLKDCINKISIRSQIQELQAHYF